MRIGIVTKWFNRGQAYISRHIRQTLIDQGHEVFILARPTKDKGDEMAAYIDRSGFWDLPGVTEAQAWDVEAAELLDWAHAEQLDVAHFDNIYQFDEITELRTAGVKTVGRWVWEYFAPEHAEGAQRAFDVIYSLTRAEQARYAEFGIESPFIQWGIHPELLETVPDPGKRALSNPDRPVTFYFPGGLLGPRKPHKAVIQAFQKTTSPHLRLVVKAQVERKTNFLFKAADADKRIELVIDDLPHEEHMQLFADCDVCIGASRWEGLGLFLQEATAFGMPVIANDDPPMNEIAIDGHNAILVGSAPDGHAQSGIEARAPDIEGMSLAMERFGDRELLAKLSDGAIHRREELAWRHTASGYSELFAAVSDLDKDAS